MPTCIFEIYSLCHRPFFGMLLCFILQKFVEIRRSLAELCLNFGHVTVIMFNICCTVHQISSKSDNFLLRYGNLTIFKMAAVRYVGFQKFAVFVMWPLPACRSASSYKILLKSDNRLTTYGQKSDFKMAAGAILNLTNFYFWSHDSYRVHYLL